MPSSEVMHKYGRGSLHSGSKRGPKVKNRKQAVAIMLSEKRAEQAGRGHDSSAAATSSRVKKGRSRGRRKATRR